MEELNSGSEEKLEDLRGSNKDLFKNKSVQCLNNQIVLRVNPEKSDFFKNLLKISLAGNEFESIWVTGFCPDDRKLSFNKSFEITKNNNELKKSVSLHPLIVVGDLELKETNSKKEIVGDEIKRQPSIKNLQENIVNINEMNEVSILSNIIILDPRNYNDKVRNELAKKYKKEDQVSEGSGSDSDESLIKIEKKEELKKDNEAIFKFKQYVDGNLFKGCDITLMLFLHTLLHKDDLSKKELKEWLRFTINLDGHLKEFIGNLDKEKNEKFDKVKFIEKYYSDFNVTNILTKDFDSSIELKEKKVPEWKKYVIGILRLAQVPEWGTRIDEKGNEIKLIGLELYKYFIEVCIKSNISLEKIEFLFCLAQRGRFKDITQEDFELFAQYGTKEDVDECLKAGVNTGKLEIKRRSNEEDKKELLEVVVSENIKRRSGSTGKVKEFEFGIEKTDSGDGMREAFNKLTERLIELRLNKELSLFEKKDSDWKKCVIKFSILPQVCEWEMKKDNYGNEIKLSGFELCKYFADVCIKSDVSLKQIKFLLGLAQQGQIKDLSQEDFELFANFGKDEDVDKCLDAGNKKGNHEINSGDEIKNAFNEVMKELGDKRLKKNAEEEQKIIEKEKYEIGWLKGLKNVNPENNYFEELKGGKGPRNKKNNKKKVHSKEYVKVVVNENGSPIGFKEINNGGGSKNNIKVKEDKKSTKEPKKSGTFKKVASFIGSKLNPFKSSSSSENKETKPLLDKKINE